MIATEKLLRLAILGLRVEIHCNSERRIEL